MTAEQSKKGCLLFDWGDTLMRVFPQFKGPMIAWPRVEAMPYAREVLENLQHKWILALATNTTNSDATQVENALQRCELGGLVELIFSFREVGHRKPSDEFYAHILQGLALDPSHVFMIGDDYYADILGANRSGIRGIWYNWRSPLSHQNDMHRTIHDLREVPAALEQLLGHDQIDRI
jgi:putative hydrolase of the HAD superfamily